MISGQLLITKSWNFSIDADIARTIIALANSLKLGVVAEGVETPEQLDWLISNGCRVFQGYLFSRPVPAGQLVSQETSAHLKPSPPRSGRQPMVK